MDNDSSDSESWRGVQPHCDFNFEPTDVDGDGGVWHDDWLRRQKIINDNVKEEWLRQQKLEKEERLRQQKLIGESSSSTQGKPAPEPKPE